MPSPSVTVYLVEMITRAEAGVDYRPRTGALCPACGYAANSGVCWPVLAPPLKV